MSAVSAHPCAAHVWGQVVSDHYPCRNAGKVERAGKWYCGRHDPERVAAQQVARDAAYEAKAAAMTARWDKAARQRRDIEAVVRWAAAHQCIVCDSCLKPPPYWQHEKAIILVAEWDAERGER